MYILNYVILLNIMTMGIGQELGSMQYCTDLQPKSNLTINKLTGKWFGADVITHMDRISGERSSRDCIYVVITEISHEVSDILLETEKKSK